MEAQCQCGLVKLSLPKTPSLGLAVCHCDKCKLMTGSAFFASFTWPAFDFPPADMKDNLSLFPQYSESGAAQHAYFCKSCGNRMVHTDERLEQWVSFSAARVVGFDWKRLGTDAVHLWTSKAVIPIPEGVVSFQGQATVTDMG